MSGAKGRKVLFTEQMSKRDLFVLITQQPNKGREQAM